MRKKFSFIFTALILCLCVVLSACGGNSTPSDTPNDADLDKGTYYTVTFDSQGGSSVESQQVLEGNTVRTPTSPKKEGAEFKGWYISASEGADIWNFSTGRVNSDLTLYAHWKELEETLTPSETLTYKLNGDGSGYFVTGDSGQATAIVIPDSHEGLPVVGIAESAFAYSEHTADILTVAIPDTVAEIEKNAFYSRDELTTVVIGENSVLAKIGNNAFSGCSSLTSIALPASVGSIGDAAFNNCGGLNAITVASGNDAYSGEGNNLIDLSTNTLIRGSNNSIIPATVTAIGDAAFRKAQLTALTIPVTVKTIGKYIIQNSLITTVIFGGTTAEWETVNKPDSWNMGKRDVVVKCSDTAQTAETLVVYFSCTNNTEKIAGFISEITGGSLYEIIPAIPYTSADLNYNTDCRANREQNDSSARPAISGKADNLAQFDVIFLGYPIWWGQAPKIIYTFLESYDFTGKTIIPFCTSGGSGIGSSATNLHSLAPAATWKTGSRFSGGAAKSDIENWVSGLDL